MAMELDTLEEKPQFERHDLAEPEISHDPEKGTVTVIRIVQFSESEVRKIKRVFTKNKIMVAPAVLRRKKWAPYDRSAQKPLGNETYCQLGLDMPMSFVCEDFKKKAELSQMEKTLSRQVVFNTIICKHCEGEHSSATCPHKKLLGVVETSITDEIGRRGYKEYSVRISNLPPECYEQDLVKLITALEGIKITRVKMPMDSATKKSRGFAYVTFERETMMNNVLASLNGKVYGYMVLNVEIAKPRVHN